MLWQAWQTQATSPVDIPQWQTLFDWGEAKFLGRNKINWLSINKFNCKSPLTCLFHVICVTLLHCHWWAKQTSCLQLWRQYNYQMDNMQTCGFLWPGFIKTVWFDRVPLIVSWWKTVLCNSLYKWRMKSCGCMYCSVYHICSTHQEHHAVHPEETVVRIRLMTSALTVIGSLSTQQLASMSKQSHTKTWSSRCGIWEDRQVSGKRDWCLLCSWAPIC